MTTAKTLFDASLALDPKKMRQRQMQIWRELITLLVQRDLRVRYRGSFFGYLWSMMNPLLYMLILTFVFSHVMKFQIENFSLFILSGILAWNLFQQSLGVGVNSIIANGSLLKKVKVPAALFPAASVASVFVNFCLSLGPFLILSVALTGKIGLSLLALPLFIVPFLVFIFGIVLALSALNVTFRDIGHVLDPLLQVLFYATPIVYPDTVFPEKYRAFLVLNPMTHFLKAFRQILYEQTWPSLTSFAILSALAAVSVSIGAFVFQKNRSRFIYEL